MLKCGVNISRISGLMFINLTISIKLISSHDIFGRMFREMEEYYHENCAYKIARLIVSNTGVNAIQLTFSSRTPTFFHARQEGEINNVKQLGSYFRWLFDVISVIGINHFRFLQFTTTAHAIQRVIKFEQLCLPSLQRTIILDRSFCDTILAYISLHKSQLWNVWNSSTNQLWQAFQPNLD